MKRGIKAEGMKGRQMIWKKRKRKKRRQDLWTPCKVVCMWPYQLQLQRIPWHTWLADLSTPQYVHVSALAVVVYFRSCWCDTRHDIKSTWRAKLIALRHHGADQARLFWFSYSVEIGPRCVISLNPLPPLLNCCFFFRLQVMSQNGTYESSSR